MVTFTLSTKKIDKITKVVEEIKERFGDSSVVQCDQYETFWYISLCEKLCGFVSLSQYLNAQFLAVVEKSTQDVYKIPLELIDTIYEL